MRRSDPRKEAGKGKRPRNNYSQQFRTRYDQIDWSDKKPKKPTKP